MSEVLVEHAPAKVNLTLRVQGRRADGYHELRSLVAFADAVDTLSLLPGDDLSLDVTGPNASACGADNLVLKASRQLAERVPCLRCGHFTLDKHLPVAAGVGGGSSDAAAALRLLARANAIALNDPRLFDAARVTGADVPVCLAAAPRVMSGIGEGLSEVVTLPPWPIVMINPGIPLATRDVFAAWSSRGSTTAVPLPGDPARLRAWIAASRNDLEQPAISLAPVIGEVLSHLNTQAGCWLARMSGSGATCFGLFETDAEARTAALALRARSPLWWIHAGVLSAPERA